MSSPTQGRGARPDSPTPPSLLNSPPAHPPPSSPLPLLPPFRASSGSGSTTIASKPTAVETARQQGVLLGVLSSVCRVTDQLYQDLRFPEKKFGKDPVHASREQLEATRKRVRRAWKTVEQYPSLAWEGELVSLCEKMFGDVLRVYHPLIDNGESASTFTVLWGEYLGTYTETISNVEKEVDKAVKELTEDPNSRKNSGTYYGGAGAGGNVRSEAPRLMRPLGP
ncbi:hypothetical protein B0T09DRAFT_277834 [Sordaria sp. MPI-SDFR-AT-0083]|nr:hypothetical protein B0T09DRAFT_277834 [Sordaria sp. MPI-SDFR-AT-0083]